MIFNIHQTIHINMIRIEGITNSSVFQIGSAGVIKPYAALANTGEFTQPAPQLDEDFNQETSFVPFPPANL